MMATLTQWRDRFLGRGDAAITIPIFDGALKPNRLLEEAELVLKLPAADDLATDGRNVFVADGKRLLRLTAQSIEQVARFEAPITALACLPRGGFAVAINGREVRTQGAPGGPRSWTQVDGKPFVAIGAISVASSGRLLVTDGSDTHPYQRWCHDLMSLGRTGRLLELDPVHGSGLELANRLGYAFGTCAVGQDAWVCESWRHRVLRIGKSGRSEVVLDALPAYPSRIAAASDGGLWLTAFVGRTQLVEFVLREDAFRKRMISEVDPRYWIAPALHSGSTFLEPLQGAGVKMRGVLKPWAPPRSYGLVMKLAKDGSICHSFHSRLDGEHHGIVAAVECDGFLYMLSKGSGRLLRLHVKTTEQQVNA
jgi:hypothetical protein